MTHISKLYKKYFARVTVSTTYVAQIDGLRFLAIIPVLVYHATLRGERLYHATNAALSGGIHVSEWIPSGEIGVALFFFISGYIISYPFLKDGGSVHVDLKRFYARRLLRLWPEYALVLLACFFALVLSGYHPTDAPRFNASNEPPLYSLLAGLAYMHGLVFDAPNRLNPPMWSLEMEVQFYLIVPLILWVVRLARHRLSLMTSIGFCVGLAVMTEAVGGYFPDTVQRWTILKYAYLFILGICFSAYALKSSPLKAEENRRFDWGLAAGLLLLCAAGSLHSWMLFNKYNPFSLRICCNTTLIGAISLIYFGALRGAAGRHIFALPWISVTGGMCYSIYLIHDPLMQGLSEILKHAIPHGTIGFYIAVSNMALVPAGLVAGSVLFAFVERPLMKPQVLDSVSNVFERLLARAASSK